MMFSPLRQLVWRMHSALRRGRPSQARGGRLRFYRPCIDTLEKREVPTVLTVTNLLDNVAGSLRAEVFLAQNGDTVQFADGLQGQITLTTGEIAINHSIDIEGPGADVIQVSGNQNGRVFNVAANQTVSISSLTMKDGKRTSVDDYGGGIYNSGTLTLNDCVVSDNTSIGRGGGAFNGSVLTLNDCIFINNTADQQGGGIWSNGPLTMNGSNIVHNAANHPSPVGLGGGGIVNYFATLTATNCNFSDNTAAGAGGGLDNNNGVSASLTGCTFTNNTGADGGGIADASSGNLTLTDCTVTGNTANGVGFAGGGIVSSLGVNGTTLTIVSSTIAYNSTTGSTSPGGGIYTGRVTVLTNDTIAGNVAGTGGGIFSFASLTAVSCTIAGNSASGNGGGLDVTSIATLRNTIVAQNTAATGNDIFGAVVPTSDYNLVGDGNGSSGLIDGVNGNQVGFYGTIDPLLDPNGLQDNGGPTQTIALLAGSPALNAGAPDLLGSSDQRGVPRSGGVNIGAFQASATAFLVVAVDMVQAGVPFDVSVTAVDPFGQVAVGYTGTVTFSSADPYGATLPADYTFQSSDAGTVTFAGGATLYTTGAWDITVTDPDSGITGSGTVTVTPAAADHLLFLQQPTDTAAGQTISPAVMVAVVDQFGNIVTSDNSDTVTLAIGVDPSGGTATLSGTLTVTVVNGVATLSDLSIDQPGVGYTLHATVGGSLPDVDSDPFTVTA